MNYANADDRYRTLETYSRAFLDQIEELTPHRNPAHPENQADSEDLLDLLNSSGHRGGNRKNRDTKRRKQREDRFNLSGRDCKLLVQASFQSSYWSVAKQERRVDVTIIATLCEQVALHFATALVDSAEAMPTGAENSTAVRIIAYQLLEFAPFYRSLEQILEAVPHAADVLNELRKVGMFAATNRLETLDSLVRSACAKYSRRMLRRPHAAPSLQLAIKALLSALDPSPES